MTENYYGLYTQLGLKLERTTGEESKGLCPFHRDTAPSLAVNCETGLWHCFVCNEGGNYEQFEKKLSGTTKEQTILLEEIEQRHKVLLETPEALKWLAEERGIPTHILERFKLGYEPGRLCIPIKEGETYFNIRRHATGKVKFGKTLSYGVGYGAVRLWPRENLTGLENEVWLCEGELDCLVMIAQGFNAVTTTGGCGTWKEEWNGLFVGKHVKIVYDTDAPGQAGAGYIADLLLPVAASVKVIVLPLLKGHKDITDYFVKEKNTRAGLLALSDEVQAKAPLVPRDPGASVETDLIRAGMPEMVGKRVKMKVMVAGKDVAPFSVPRKLEYTCKMGLKICATCPIYRGAGKVSVDISDKDSNILKLLKVTDDQQKFQLKKFIAIPGTCMRFETKALEYHNIEELTIYPHVDVASEELTPHTQSKGYAINGDIRTNIVYEVGGLVMPHPKDQSLTFLFSDTKVTEDDLENYVPTADDLEDLKIFQPHTTVMERMQDIACDLTHNVTKIYGREDLIYAMDLVMHSSLQFNFQDQMITRGWVEGLVVGDTRCGKSDTSTALRNHYRLGDIIDTENTSLSGILGGMSSNGSSWSILWGKIPLNDRRAIIFDEVSGMSHETIASLSGVRSRGEAQITKIKTEKCTARVRKLWLSNPRPQKGMSSNKVSAFANCTKVITNLIGANEDIARFDFGMVISTDDVSIDVINRSRTTKITHKFTSTLCKKLLLWVWSRKRSQIVFEEDATEECLKQAKIFSDIYDNEENIESSVPLVNRTEQRIKFARLGAAVAARVFSTDDGVTLRVKKEHIEVAAKLLERWYSNANFGYRYYAQTATKEEGIDEESKNYILNIISPLGKRFVKNLLALEIFNLNDLADLTGCDTNQTRTTVLSPLINSQALKKLKGNGHYHLAPGFIKILKELKDSDYKPKEEAF